MVLFKNFFKKKEAVFIDGGGGVNQEVVGESFYQKHLKKICGGISKEKRGVNAIATVHYEDDNEHDKKAIRIDIKGKTVGYLPKADARRYRKKVEKLDQKGITLSCDAVILILQEYKTGRFSATNFSVWLDLPIDEL
jgi:hypothetical protein